MRREYYNRNIYIDGKNTILTILFNSEEKSNIGVVGLLDLISSLNQELSPMSITVVWGDDVSKSKVNIYSDYCGKKKDKFGVVSKEIIDWQIKLCRELLSYTRVKQVYVPETESRDVLGFLATQDKKEKIIVSTDKLFYQIVSNKNILYNIRINSIVDVRDIELELGFPIKYFLLWKSIVGDSSKSIPGIKGVGKVKATRLIQSVLKTKMKFSLSSEEQKALNRNKYLLSIGKLIGTEDKKKIIKQRKSNKSKRPKEYLKSKLIELGISESFFRLVSITGMSDDGHAVNLH